MGLKPAFRILANSDDVTSAIMDRFVSLTLTDAAGFESDTFEVTVADHLPLMPVAMPDTGAELEVFLGYDGELSRMGLFVVDEVELSGWPGRMTIRAKAAPYETSAGGKTNLQTQKRRSWPKDTTIGALVGKIAGEHGMESAVSQSLASVKLPHMDQTDESDISFLVRVGRRYDALVKPAGGKIVFAKRGEMKSASGEPLEPVQVHASQVSSYRMTLAKRDKPGTVIAYYQDRRKSKKTEVKLGDGEPVRRLRHHYADEEAAREGAQAELDKRARGEHSLHLTMPGHPMLAAEVPLHASGFRPDVNGEWLVCRAVHSLTKGGGYQCDVEAEKPGASAKE